MFTIRASTYTREIPYILRRESRRVHSQKNRFDDSALKLRYRYCSGPSDILLNKSTISTASF